MATPPRNIRLPSLMSLPLIPMSRRHELAFATGFVVVYQEMHYLITNWHVAAGRNPEDGQPMASTAEIPDQLVVVHNVAGEFGKWKYTTEDLYDDDGGPRWLEHPVHGRRVDVVAIPITQTEDVKPYPYDPANPGPTITMGPSDPISVIGFPFGITGGGAMGIWVQGTLASEPSVDWNDLPCFLIDSRTRSGQSGSPAILYRSGMYMTDDGSVMANSKPVWRFVGVYSGRIHSQSDLGFIWKVRAIIEILDGQHWAPLPTVGPRQ
jgi:hypothetical protein